MCRTHHCRVAPNRIKVMSNGTLIEAAADLFRHASLLQERQRLDAFGN
ncbi:hypothetical protein H5395_17580 [Paracoccus sp. MC1854]|nr:hypothetical protein [Paracoccus sp. MC1854]MBB1493260.1 hypothetical protein [Paracoccus sp. MC1854]